VVEALVNAGVGAVIAVVILVGLYRIVGRLGGKFIEAEQRQAEALGAQAQAMEGLTRSVGEFLARDMTEHREMLVLLRFMVQRKDRLEEVRREHDECEA
jgi:hypothetical protein